MPYGMFNYAIISVYISVHTTEAADFFINIGTLPATLNFLPTESSKTIIIRSAQDDIVEGMECFLLTLASVNTFVTIPVSGGRATVCIQDDDS